jgi:RimJ/RimL family protein N-acetyltransferase
MGTPQVRLEAWTEGDLDLLRRTNVPEMTEHLGGPESDDEILARHQRYLDSEGMFRIVLLPGGKVVGNVGYWERVWRGETVYETGWNVLPEYQGRGIAAAGGAAVLARVRREHRHRNVHAFPSIDNPASNAVCRKLGFVLAGECDFEYPHGHLMRCNDWRLDLG